MVTKWLTCVTFALLVETGLIFAICLRILDLRGEDE
jgi:hypothetical protein